MKFYEKYPQLRQKNQLVQILTDTVYTTMSLENQQVEKTKVAQIVLSILKNEESKGSHFFVN